MRIFDPNRVYSKQKTPDSTEGDVKNLVGRTSGTL